MKEKIHRTKFGLRIYYAKKYDYINQKPIGEVFVVALTRKSLIKNIKKYFKKNCCKFDFYIGFTYSPNI